MRFTFLGTSAGAPTLQRNVTGLALAFGEQRDWYLVDCGEATQHQLLRCRYSSSKLQAIFITHVHGDHSFGLPGLLASANMAGRTSPLTICAPEGIEEFVRAALQYTDVNELRYPLHFVRSDKPGFEFSDERLEVTSHALSHRVASFAYKFVERCVKPQLDRDKLTALNIPEGPLWGQLQHGASITLDDQSVVTPDQVHKKFHPRKVVVAGDNDKPELLDAALEDADLLIHEATFTEQILAKVGPQYQHSTAQQVAQCAQRSDLKNLVLTHFSARYQHSIEPLAAEAACCFDGNLFFARDFLCLELQRDKNLIELNEQHQPL